MGSAAELFRSPAFWLGMLLLVVMFVIGFYVIAWTRQWMRESREVQRDIEDELAHYLALRDSGEISEEEFQRISDMMFPKPRDELSSDNDASEEEPPGDE